MLFKRKTTLIVFLSALIVFPAWTQAIFPADSTGLPGDNFSLEGALELFKKSASPEEFEKLLNTEDKV
jgi:hypothetical protein